MTGLNNFVGWNLLKRGKMLTPAEVTDEYVIEDRNYFREESSRGSQASAVWRDYLELLLLRKDDLLFVAELCASVLWLEPQQKNVQTDKQWHQM